MIDVQKYILMTMKKEIFGVNNEQNKAARQVLAEMKTKQKDIQDEITSEIQYKMLKKMLSERTDSKQTYISNERYDLAAKEREEESVIKKLMEELEADLPKQMTEDEIRSLINITIKGMDKPNIGLIMRAFKDIKNVDKALVSKIAKEYV